MTFFNKKKYETAHRQMTEAEIKEKFKPEDFEKGDFTALFLAGVITFVPILLLMFLAFLVFSLIFK